MKWGKACKLAKKGKTVAREGWKENEFIYYISHSDLCTAFNYGYGEYIGEPSFLGVIAKLKSNNTIQVGWEPKKQDIQATDWKVVGQWKAEETVQNG